MGLEPSKKPAIILTMQKDVQNKKVFVGLSGGVDSSVSAYLLKKQGYDVTGVFIKVWYPDFIDCDWRSEMQDAMRVCAKLDIPFLLCDSEKEYKEGVIDYMISEYKAGRTPNPDVMCNKEVKFKAFLNFAIQNGADYVATGHYAQTEHQNLLKSVDTNKDQTYFLWNLNKEILTKTLFPIGHLEKTEVRKIAKQADLLTATKKDSQGLCFIGHVDMKEFLQHYIDTTPGDVLDESGKTIGRHDGAILYTMGERHGFEIFDQDTDKKPVYIIDKNIEKNTITVSEERISENSDRVILEKVNFVNEVPAKGAKIFAKTRYRQADQICTISNYDPKTAQVEIKFDENQAALTRGQSVVLYDTEKCLGGGIIS
jgi:tRNA-specific 2-thiouridylase